MCQRRQQSSTDRLETFQHVESSSLVQMLPMYCICYIQTMAILKDGVQIIDKVFCYLVGGYVPHFVLPPAPLSGMLQPTGHPSTQYCGKNQQTFSSSQPLQQGIMMDSSEDRNLVNYILKFQSYAYHLKIKAIACQLVASYGLNRIGYLYKNPSLLANQQIKLSETNIWRTRLDYDTEASWDKLANALKEMGKPVVATKIYTYVPGYRGMLQCVETHLQWWI